MQAGGLGPVDISVPLGGSPVATSFCRLGLRLVVQFGGLGPVNISVLLEGQTSSQRY